MHSTLLNRDVLQGVKSVQSATQISRQEPFSFYFHTERVEQTEEREHKKMFFPSLCVCMCCSDVLYLEDAQAGGF